VLAVIDDRLARPGRRYRGVPLVSSDRGLALDADAYVVSNTSYVHAQQRCAALVRQTSRPVYNWFDPPPGGAADAPPVVAFAGPRPARPAATVGPTPAGHAGGSADLPAELLREPVGPDGSGSE